jgi:acyl dehydratase
MTEKYLEDYAVGQTFGSSGRLRIERERIKDFAAEFDPQPFHLDEEAARESIFRGLAASGWHTAAVTMRLLVESDLKPVGGIQGLGFGGSPLATAGTPWGRAPRRVRGA